MAKQDQAPSLSEVARQIGIKRQTLKSLFPDLCDQIAAKYRAWKHKQHEERIARICAAVRQATIMLHQQGIYPGGVKVARLIGDSAILATKEALFEWQTALKELGYRENVTVGSA